ncbi:MAG: hypothetical protein AB1Z22_12845 [Synechococcaceae cyanobacterium]
MADSRPLDQTGSDHPRPVSGGDSLSGQGSAILASAVAGALVGAAGLAWWLLSLAERRRLAARQQRTLQLSRLQGGADPLDDPQRAHVPAQAPRDGSAEDRDLHDKVHELNQAIEAVRRQLEQLQPQG